MAAWLQKRLKDAEALLEQADRTAQRVVVKDQDQDKPRNPQSVGVFPSGECVVRIAYTLAQIGSTCI